MTDAVAPFLAGAGWAGAELRPLAADASARQYQRVALAAKTAVLMQAPVTEQTAFQQFIRMAHWLRSLGLSAPEIYAQDARQALMLLEDFGDGLMARLADAGRETELYEATVDALVPLVRVAPPDWIAALDPVRMARQTALTFEEMPGECRLRHEVWSLSLAACLARHLPPAIHVALRDLHAENVIWLEDRDGVARVGLLDFQDAVAAPLGYDLASLVDDPRRDVPGPLRAALIGRFAKAMSLPEAQMEAHVNLLSLARNLRILGIFRRAARLRDRPAYLDYLPRTARLIRAAVMQPEAAPLRRDIEAILEAYGLEETA